MTASGLAFGEQSKWLAATWAADGCLAVVDPEPDGDMGLRHRLSRPQTPTTRINVAAARAETALR